MTHFACAMTELCYGLLISRTDLIRVILKKYLGTNDATRDNLFKLARHISLDSVDQDMSDDDLVQQLIYAFVVEDPPLELYAHSLDNGSYFIGTYLPSPHKGTPLDEYLSSRKVADRMYTIRHALAEYSWYDIAEMSEYLCVYMLPIK